MRTNTANNKYSYFNTMSLQDIGDYDSLQIPFIMKWELMWLPEKDCGMIFLLLCSLV